MAFDKYAAITNKRAQINSMVIDNIARYVALSDVLDEMVRNPCDQSASAVDGVFRALATDLNQLQNAITTLANVIVSEDGEIDEVDGVEEEDGIRLQ